MPPTTPDAVFFATEAVTSAVFLAMPPTLSVTLLSQPGVSQNFFLPFFPLVLALLLLFRLDCLLWLVERLSIYEFCESDRSLDVLCITKESVVLILSSSSILFVLAGG